MRAFLQWQRQQKDKSLATIAGQIDRGRWDSTGYKRSRAKHA